MNRILVLAASTFLSACGGAAARGPSSPEVTASEADPSSEYFVSRSEMANRAEIEALVAARAHAITERDWERYVALVHPDAVVEATATRVMDHDIAMEVMLMKAHEVVDGMRSDTATVAPDEKTLGIVREGDRLHALVGIEGGVPLLMSFRAHDGKWMLDIPPELVPFVHAGPAELPPKIDKVPGAVAAAFDRYVASQGLLSDRSMLEYAKTMHPEGLRKFHRTLKEALNQLTEEEDAADEEHPGLKMFLDMVEKPLLEFYVAYNDAIYRNFPRFTTRHFVLGGVKSPSGVWLIVRQENSLQNESRSFLVKVHMRQHEGQWRRDIGAEIGPKHVASLVYTLKTLVDEGGAYNEAITSIEEAGRGAAEDGEPYQCEPGRTYLFRVVAASRSEKEGYVQRHYEKDVGGEQTYVNVKKLGLCDGHVRSVTRGEGGSHRISIGLTASGQDSFAQFTERFLQQPVAFLVGEEITSLPIVVNVIQGHTLPVNLPATWTDAEIQRYMRDLEATSRKLRRIENL